MKTNAANLKRRNFLLTVGLGGAGAAAALVGRKTVQRAEQGGEDTSAAGSGYRLTEHIRNYYRTTRV